MPKMKTPDGMEHEITEVDFESPQEDWVEYTLSDGTKMKFRTTILSIVRSNKYDEHGQPMYFVKSQNQVRTYCLDDLIDKNEPVIESKDGSPEDNSPEGYR